jgi:hypothetical protein
MAKMTQLKIELEQEEDGRWNGEVPSLPGVMAYGQTKASRVLSALLRIGWQIKRTTGSHRVLQRSGCPMSSSLFTTTRK